MKDLIHSTSVVLKSFYGYEIDEVKIMGNDRYILAHTSDSLLLADSQKSVMCEVGYLFYKECHV